MNLFCVHKVYFYLYTDAKTVLEQWPCIKNECTYFDILVFMHHAHQVLLKREKSNL